MDGKEIIPFIDPIYRFCHHRLSNWHDAEDLAHEILLHALDGMGKYDIESLEAWVWRIAHNRYARFVAAVNKKKDMLSCQDLFEIEDDYCQIDEDSVEEEYEPIFRSLHTLSAQYRDIFVDYYIGEMSVKKLSEKYFLPETTVKWRLNVGRSRIRERVGVNRMDKVYKRINWNTNGCNGSMDSDRYLHTQIARAICQAAYEKPLTVEEISLCTGIPAMYIEDELPRLEYGFHHIPFAGPGGYRGGPGVHGAGSHRLLRGAALEREKGLQGTGILRQRLRYGETGLYSGTVFYQAENGGFEK